MGVTNRKGTSRIVLSNHPENNRICFDTAFRNVRNAERGHFLDVQTISLDDYFGDSLEAIYFIKMDIQGAEYSKLVGTRKE